jgi:hypothetical protein
MLTMRRWYELILVRFLSFRTEKLTLKKIFLAFYELHILKFSERKIETVQEELDYTRRVRAEEIEDLKVKFNSFLF